MRIEELLKETCVLADLKGETKQEILYELVAPLKKENLIDDPETVVNIVLQREKLGSTGIGDSVAIPHGKVKSTDNFLCVFGRSARGVDFGAVDGKPVHIFFLLLAPEEQAGLHLKMLSRISKLLRDGVFRKRLISLDNSKEIYRNIVEEDNRI